MPDGGQSEQRRLSRRLVAVGMTSGVIVLAIALLARRFVIAVPSVDRPHLTTSGLFAALFGLYLIALSLATRIQDPMRVLRIVCVFAVFYRAILLFTPPIQEIDLYRYVWDGNVLANGVDPYRFSPKNVIDAASWATLADASVTGAQERIDDPLPEDPLQRLVAVQRRSPALERILRIVHYAELPTPYPPVSQGVFALAAVTTPDRANVQTHLTVMKAWVVLFDLLTLAAMIALLKAIRLPVGWCLAYAWCPLVLKEFANSGHLDSIAVCLTTTSLWQLVLATRNGGHWRVVASATALGLGVGAKLYPVILMPVVLVWIVRRSQLRSAALFALVAAGVGGATLWPMLGVDRPIEIVATPNADSLSLPPPPTDLDSDDSVPQKRIDAASRQSIDSATDPPQSGLRAFFTRWKMNDFLFLIINENLDPSAPVSRQPWFAVVPDRFRIAIVSPVMEAQGTDAASAAFLTSRAVTLTIFGVLTLYWSWSLWRADKIEDARFLEVAFLTQAWFWLLTPTQNPWYWTWCLPLLPFARSRAWLAVSGLVMTYYLRFWLNAHWPEPPGPLGSRHDGASFFDFVLVWLEYVPVFVGLLIGRLVRRSRGDQ